MLWAKPTRKQQILCSSNDIRPWLTDKTNTPHPLAPSPTRGEGEKGWLQLLAPLARSGRGAGGEGHIRERDLMTLY